MEEKQKSAAQVKTTIDVDAPGVKSAPTPIKEFSNFLAGITSLSGEMDGGLREYYKKQKLGKLDEFVGWLGANEQYLLSQLKTDVLSGKIQLKVRVLDKKESISYNKLDRNEMIQIIGFWLGTRYIASRFEAKGTREFPQLIVNLFETNGFYWDNVSRSSGFITSDSTELHFGIPLGEKASTDAEKIDSLLISLNSGIHEGAHALKYMTGRSETVDWSLIKKFEYATKEDKERYDAEWAKIERNTLSELASFYCQTTYGLPIRNETLAKGNNWAYGARDSNVIWNGILNGEIQIKPGNFLAEEYTVFVLGPWIKAFYEKKGVPFDVFSFGGDWFDKDKSALNTPKEHALMFCREYGMRDIELQGKIVDYFALLQKTTSGMKIMGVGQEDGLIRFLNIYNCATEVFGKPKVEKVPKGYAKSTEGNDPVSSYSKQFFKKIT